MTQLLLGKQKIVLLILLHFFCNTNVKSQILEKTISNFKSLHNISYTAELKDKDLFSDSVFSQ